MVGEKISKLLMGISLLRKHINKKLLNMCIQLALRLVSIFTIKSTSLRQTAKPLFAILFYFSIQNKKESSIKSLIFYTK